MKSVILAAGKGENLYPLTVGRQKESLIIMGKPLIYYSLKGLSNYSSEIVVVVREGDESVSSSIREKGMTPKTVTQKGEGIEGAILSAKSIIDDNFILAFGDIIAESDFYRRIAFSHENGKVTISLIPVSKGINTYGIAFIDESGKPIKVMEKPKEFDEMSSLALGGLYILQYDVFDFLEGGGSFIDYINKKIKEEGVNSFIWDGKWVDIGYPEDFLRALSLFLNNENSVISSRAEVSSKSSIGKGVVIDDDAIIDDYSVIKGPAYIGKGALIGAHSLIRGFSSIEEKAIVGAYCEVSSSFVMKGAKLFSKSYASYSVIGENAMVGEGSIVMSYVDKVENIRLEEEKRKVTVINHRAKTEPYSVIKPGSIVI